MPKILQSVHWPTVGASVAVMLILGFVLRKV